MFDEDERSATVEITATQQQMLVDKPSRMVFTMDEEPVEIGVWIECVCSATYRLARNALKPQLCDDLFFRDERRVISMDEKKLIDLLEQATSDSERPAPPSVLEHLAKEARAATPETALRMARWLKVRLQCSSIPVLLKTLQLIDRLLQAVRAAANQCC